MMGQSKEEPMTLYSIEEIGNDNVSARFISISETGIADVGCPQEYEKDLPEDAVTLPGETFDQVRGQMDDFCTQTNEYIRGNLAEGDHEPEIGSHYYDWLDVYTVTGFEGDRVHYDIIRLDPLNISPCWTGNALAKDCNGDLWRNIPDDVYEEVLSRYREFLSHLRDYLSGLAGRC